jgi:hypothetical protein
VREVGPNYGRGFDPVRLLNLVDGLSAADQARVVGFVEGLGE